MKIKMVKLLKIMLSGSLFRKHAVLSTIEISSPLLSRRFYCCNIRTVKIGCARFAQKDPCRIFFKSLFLLILSMGLGACGGTDYVRGPAGSLALVVKDVNGSTMTQPRGKIATYKIIVSGDDFDPITVDVPADRSGATLEKIPVGKNRQVTVTAYNQWSQKIREAESASVTVSGGKTVPVSVTLETVPIFLNLQEGAVIDNNRFAIQLLSDPRSSVKVEEPATQGALKDIHFSISDLRPNDAGEVRLVPPLFSPGLHQFTVRDLVSGRTSTVSVRLLDGTRRKGTSFVSAGIVSRGTRTIFGWEGQ